VKKNSCDDHVPLPSPNSGVKIEIIQQQKRRWLRFVFCN